MSRVCILACGEYEYDGVLQTMRQAISALGGIGRFIRPGMKVLVKPNLVRKGKPEVQMTTHPSVVRAVAQIVREADAFPVIADSPGGIYTKAVLKALYEETGMKEAARLSGATLGTGCEVADVYYEQGVVLRSFKIIRPMMDCDAVITVAKLKTHEMMAFSGASKNLFGIVPGITKLEYHYRMPGQDEFANMLADIAAYARPALSVIDAVWGMEGDGPCAGDPRKIGALIVSDNPFSADLAALSIIGFEPDDVPLLKNALKRGLTPPLDEVELTGDPPEGFAIKDYKKPATLYRTLLEHRLPRFLRVPLEKLFVLRPFIDEKQCVGCGICAKYCPVGAIHIGPPPVIDETACIRCYCCHELCPQKAVHIKRPLVFRVLTKLFR